MNPCDCATAPRHGLFCPARCESGEIDTGDTLVKQIEADIAAELSLSRHEPGAAFLRFAASAPPFPTGMLAVAVDDERVLAGLRELTAATVTRSPQYGCAMEWDMGEFGGEA